MRRAPRVVVVAIVAASVVCAPGARGVSGVRAAVGVCPERTDFNSDGYDDIAVGLADAESGHAQDVAGVIDAGAVQILFGSATGIAGADSVFSLQTSGVEGSAAAEDLFGAAVAAGDFNGDGFSDLVAGAPGAGSVHVLYGTTAGPTASATGTAPEDQRFTQGDFPGITPEDGDAFGAALVAADFTGDGFSDLAIGAPGEDVGSTLDAGAIHVLLGTADGLTTVGALTFTQDSTGIADGPEAMERFGLALTACDFNDDGKHDLAIGVREDLGDGFEGAVHVLRGATAGVTTTGAQFLTEDAIGTESGATGSEPGDLFGSALAAGDTDGDGYADLTVGAPGQDIDGNVDTGAVVKLFGSASGLSLGGDRYWHQATSMVPGAGEGADAWGSSLALGDVDDDGFADLIVGAPDENVLDAIDGGAITFLAGSSSGLTTTAARGWTQDSPGVVDVVEPGDMFGGAVAVGDYDGDDLLDIAIGVPLEDVVDVSNAGAVTVLYGARGLTPTQLGIGVDQDSPGMNGAAEADDRFGSALA